MLNAYKHFNFFKMAYDTTNLRLTITDESVTIERVRGTLEPEHIAFWHLDEIEEDATVGLVIANAVHLFYADPETLLSTLDKDNKTYYEPNGEYLP